MSEYPTEAQLINAIKERDFGFLGWRMWEAFCTLPKTSEIRKYHEKVWDSLSEEQQEKCED